MLIRDYSDEFLTTVADLFFDAVHNIDDTLYTREQKSAWAPQPIDYSAWQTHLAKNQTFLAIIKNRLAGFIELKSDGYIYCFYVAPLWQRQGVGKALYRHCEKKATNRGLVRLSTHASLAAKPAFLRLGFSVVQENQALCRGMVLKNFLMQKDIAKIC